VGARVPDSTSSIGFPMAKLYVSLTSSAPCGLHLQGVVGMGAKSKPLLSFQIVSAPCCVPVIHQP